MNTAPFGCSISRIPPQEGAASHYYASNGEAARREDSVNAAQAGLKSTYAFTDPSQSLPNLNANTTQAGSPADERPDAHPTCAFSRTRAQLQRNQSTTIAKRESRGLRVGAPPQWGVAEGKATSDARTKTLWQGAGHRVVAPPQWGVSRRQKRQAMLNASLPFPKPGGNTHEASFRCHPQL